MTDEGLLRTRRVPALTLTFCGLTAVGLVLQSMSPQLVHVFERNADAVFGGQWWRLVTSLFFQDGGVAGGISNIAALFFVGGLAEQMLAPAEWIGIYWLGALAAGIAGLAWQPVGAGNSIAICSLAGALTAAWPAEGRRASSVAWRGVVAVGAGFLLARRDIHGLAFVAGALSQIRTNFRAT